MPTVTANNDNVDERLFSGDSTSSSSSSPSPSASPKWVRSNTRVPTMIHDHNNNPLITTTTTTVTLPPPPPTSKDSTIPSAEGNRSISSAPSSHGPIGSGMSEKNVGVDAAVGAGGARKELDKRSLDYLMRSGLAGGLAGCAAKTVVGPLDRVKILFQTSSPQFAKYTTSWFGVVNAMQNINQNEGMRGLYKGHSATLLRIFPYAAIKFLAYEQIRAVFIPSKQYETPFRRLISGSLAGITSVFFTYPLEVIRVRLAFETKKDSKTSLRRICKQIFQERCSSTLAPASASTSTAASAVEKVTIRSGLANFYRGFSPTMLGMLPYAGVSFLTHDTVGDYLRSPSLARHTTIPDSDKNPSRSHRIQLTASAELFSGAVAGLVSQTCSYPLEVIRRRMQVGGVVGDGHRLNILETAKTVWARSGFRGFFVGLTIGYMKVVPMGATSFFVYERGKWYLGI